MKKRIKEIVNRAIKKSYWYNEIAFKDCRKFWEIKGSQFDVVNLGSSSGVYDFDYRDVNLNCANWAIAPQTMVGDFAVLKQYSNYLKKGATIIYPICPFTSISGSEEYVEDRCYSFLDFNLIPHAHYIRMTKVMQMKEAPLQFYPLMAIKYDIISKFKSSDKCSILDDDKMDQDANIVMNSWKKQFNIDDLTLGFEGRNKANYEKGILLLRNILNYCKEKDFKLVVVVPPMHSRLAKLFSEFDKKNLIDDFVQSGIDSSIKYYNMMEDSRYSNNNEWFRGSYYFNPIGARQFTKDLIDTLGIKKR